MELDVVDTNYAAGYLHSITWYLYWTSILVDIILFLSYTSAETYIDTKASFSLPHL